SPPPAPPRAPSFPSTTLFRSTEGTARLNAVPPVHRSAARHHRTAATPAPRLSLNHKSPRPAHPRSTRPTTHAARAAPQRSRDPRSEEHTSELQSRENLVCRLL